MKAFLEEDRMRNSFRTLVVASIFGITCSMASSRASAGDVLCSAGDAEIAQCQAKDGMVYAHATGQSLNDQHWVDVTIYPSANPMCQVACDLTIYWSGGSETFWKLVPWTKAGVPVPGVYPSHDVPADPTLMQLLCFCQ